MQADGGNIRNRWPALRFYKAQLDRLQAAIARVAICAHRCTLHHRASLCNNKCENATADDERAQSERSGGACQQARAGPRAAPAGVNFAPSSLKFLLLSCHPAKRALATYRFRYFGKGEFAFRKKPLRTLEDASPTKLFFEFFGLIHLR